MVCCCGHSPCDTEEACGSDVVGPYIILQLCPSLLLGMLIAGIGILIKDGTQAVVGVVLLGVSGGLLMWCACVVLALNREGEVEIVRFSPATPQSDT